MAVYVEYTDFDPDWSARFFLNFTKQAGFHGLVAVFNERVVGFTFGHHSQNGDWWHDEVAYRVGVDHPALRDAWVLTQLNVLKAYRGQGIGSQLHDLVIAQQPHTNLLLSTQTHNQRAQAFYKQRGWSVLHDGFAFAKGDDPFMILCKSLAV